MKDECKVSCVKIIAWSVVVKEGSTTTNTEQGTEQGAEYGAESGAK